MAGRQAISGVLERAVEAGAVPGVVAVASDGRDILYEGAFGRRDLAGDQAMTADTVVWIASMTKAVTGAAAMRLVEQGRIGLDQPAAEVVPRLADARVLEGFDASGQPRLRPPKRPVTLRHLLAHTSGFSYDIWSEDVGRYMEATGTPGITTCRDKALTTPLLHEPGERWTYGIGIDWAGKMVEAVAGKRLGEHLREAIFEPLGMADTGFKPGPSQKARLARVHARGPGGELTPTDFAMPAEPEFEMGGGGLYSTARDYLAFANMVLNGGRHGGTQVLKPETVEEMKRDQIAGLPMTPFRTAIPGASNDVDLFPGMALGWGLTFLVNHERTPQGRSPGSLAWAGLANTYYWIDPAKKVAGVFLTQILPFFDAKAVALFGDFETEVYRSL